MAFLDLTWRTLRPVEGFYTTEVQAPKPLPVRTFLPVGYEPRYAYPLVVFFHDHGSNEEQILRLAPRLSRRNYISIGLRGPISQGQCKEGGNAYSWNDDGGTSDMEDYLFRAVEQTRLSYHVHSERIYLAGFGEGATMAYRLGMSFPEKFGGVISLNGCMPRQNRPLMRWPDVRSLRVFIGHGLADAVMPWSMARDDYKLLYSAGLPLEMHTYPTTHRVHPNMLRDVNRWIIARCNEE